MLDSPIRGVEFQAAAGETIMFFLTNQNAGRVHQTEAFLCKPLCSRVWTSRTKSLVRRFGMLVCK